MRRRLSFKSLFAGAAAVVTSCDIAQAHADSAVVPGWEILDGRFCGAVLRRHNCTTLGRARAACSSDAACGGIYDRGCDGDPPFYMCTNRTSRLSNLVSRRHGCLYVQSDAFRLRSAWPQRNNTECGTNQENASDLFATLHEATAACLQLGRCTGVRVSSSIHECSSGLDAAAFSLCTGAFAPSSTGNCVLTKSTADPTTSTSSSSQSPTIPDFDAVAAGTCSNITTSGATFGNGTQGMDCSIHADCANGLFCTGLTRTCYACGGITTGWCGPIECQNENSTSLADVGFGCTLGSRIWG